MRYFSILGLLALLAGVCAGPALAFDFADARRIVTLSDPQISPDGKYVVYLRGKADFSKNRIDRQLVLIDSPDVYRRWAAWLDKYLKN